MLPEKFKDIFGLKDEKDMKMANNIWKMLDEMSSNDPTAYQKFIQKNLTQGLTDAKAEKQKKQKPYRITPHEYMLLEMEAQLEEQYAVKQKDAEFKEKLDMNINKQKWSDVKAKFSNRIEIYLNICHTDRVKNTTLKSKSGQEVKEFNISMLKDIENLYYSFQGPIVKENNWYFCLIFNSNFLRAFESVPNGRRVFLGIATAYFQERLKNDRNPVLMKVDTLNLYGKNLYYGIDKHTIQINQTKKFIYGDNQKVCEFLLEKEVDVKEREIKQKKQKKEQKPAIMQQSKSSQPAIKQTKKSQILIHPQKQPIQQNTTQLPPLVPTKKQPNKKVLIQVLDEHENKEEEDKKISYELKQSEEGYQIQFLVHGVEKIDDLDLEVSKDTVKLRTVNKNVPERAVEIKLKKQVDENKVKAKMKKKTHTLSVTLIFSK